MKTSLCGATVGSLLVVGMYIAPMNLGAQVRVESEAAVITLTGQIQAQLNTTSVEGEMASEYLMRRVRLTTRVQVNDLVSGKAQPDFGGGGVSLKDAYVRLAFDPAFRATVGQFKRPFDLFELTSSSQILVIERDGEVRGAAGCGSVGGVCSLSRLTEELEYAARDIGVLIDGEKERFRYMISATNGSGANASEENDAKSYTGRVEVRVAPDLTVAGNVGLHDFVNLVDSEDDYAIAYGADVEWGDFQQGWHVQAGLVAGDNWTDLDGSGAPATFTTLQGIVTYKRPVDARLAQAVEPLGRISYGDPNTDVDGDGGWLITPGFVMHFVGRNKVAVNVDIWSPSEGESEWSFKAMTQLHF